MNTVLESVHVRTLIQDVVHVLFATHYAIDACMKSMREVNQRISRDPQVVKPEVEPHPAWPSAITVSSDSHRRTWVCGNPIVIIRGLPLKIYCVYIQLVTGESINQLRDVGDSTPLCPVVSQAPRSYTVHH